jgi:hypothetical protein
MTRCFCDRSTGDALIFVVSKSCSGGQMSEDGIQVTLHSAKLEVEEYNSSWNRLNWIIPVAGQRFAWKYVIERMDTSSKQTRFSDSAFVCNQTSPQGSDKSLAGAQKAM